MDTSRNSNFEWHSILLYLVGDRTFSIPSCLECRRLCFIAVALKPLFSPVIIFSPRPIVHFLSRGPDKARGEDRWGILSQSQIPDPTGMSVLS